MKLTNLIKHSLLIAFAGLIANTSHADSLDDIKKSLTSIVGPRGAAATVVESPMKGVYQVDLGDRVVFVSQNGNHLLLGDVFDTERRVSLAEELKQQKALKIVSAMEEDSMIVFNPKETKRTITVYTDVDCPYCRKLHEEVPTLLENGVKVRYLWYPRSGIGTPSYDKAVSIWCADDQVTAMNDAKLNNEISPLKCDPNPVKAQYESGHQVGVRGTPTIVIDDGTIIGGYLPAKNLLANLGLVAPDLISNSKLTQ